MLIDLINLKSNSVVGRIFQKYLYLAAVPVGATSDSSELRRIWGACYHDSYFTTSLKAQFLAFEFVL